ncbi:YbaB/EbfC family nucleoid-associated protein [Saccharomonospora sp.]|uniref:YbaB/EbfC family nucleoid-associated protein n=1 Tax=Saccharomonospora sp. TaxID=33913 RepID=UPI00263205D8|nr:YbaB/EbfC family nucleoid-associated protein [Saccharomonospora sp.]
MSETIKRLLRRVEAIDTAAAENRARAENYRRMTEELADVTGTASSPDGVVTVVAGPDGPVKEITFSEQVRKVDPAALSAIVVHTIAQARVEATRGQAEVMRRNLDDTHLLDQVLAEDARMFGDQRPVDPGPPPVATTIGAPVDWSRSQSAARRVSGDGDSFEDFQILRRP